MKRDENYLTPHHETEEEKFTIYQINYGKINLKRKTLFNTPINKILLL